MTSKFIVGCDLRATFARCFDMPPLSKRPSEDVVRKHITDALQSQYPDAELDVQIDGDEVKCLVRVPLDMVSVRIHVGPAMCPAEAGQRPHHKVFNGSEGGKTKYRCRKCGEEFS